MFKDELFQPDTTQEHLCYRPILLQENESETPMLSLYIKTYSVHTVFIDKKIVPTAEIKSKMNQLYLIIDEQILREEFWTFIWQ